MNEPSKIKAGFSSSWEETLSEYPASEGWVMKYVLLNATHKISITSEADGDLHKVSLAANTTAAYNAGEYNWFKYVEKADEKIEIDEGSVEIIANVLTANTLDTRTQAKKTLDAINATILGGASKDQMSMSVDGFALQRRSYKELLLLKGHYENIVDGEEKAARRKKGLPAGGRIYIRFGKS